MKILILKHLWKTKIGPLEQILLETAMGHFFGAPCIIEHQTKEFILKELSNNKTATASQSHNFQER